MKTRRLRKRLWVLITLVLMLSMIITPAVAEGNAARLSVSDLTVEHMTNPLGIDATVPRFSWIAEASYNGARQTAYEIRVSSNDAMDGDVWSTGRVESTQSFDVEYAGPPLQSQTRYYWAVRVWNEQDNGPSQWSERAWFETAFLDAGEFGGEWIGSPTTDERQEILLRKEFSLSKLPIASARVYVAGYGYYKLYINGERVGDRELDPAYTPYQDRVVYITYDVTDLLERGDTNAIGVSLGQGYYGQPVLKLQLDVTYVNGTSSRMESDLSWKTSDGPITYNRVAPGGGFGPSDTTGEIYDARLEQPGWNAPGFDATAWSEAILLDGPTGVLQAMDVEPIRVTSELEVKEVTNPQPGVYVYDFKTTRAGWATVSMTGPEGATVVMQYAEKLNDDGIVDNSSGFGGSPDLQKYTYTLRGNGLETYTPSYSYAGYRFLMIMVPEGVTIESVVGKTLNTDIAATGAFSSSDELLNRYHDAMRASTLSNLYSIPTDTPMWEKAGWTADGQLISENALINLASENLWEKWMLDHKYSQAADGGLNVVVPRYPLGGNDPIWTSSYIFVNYSMYLYRGNVRTLEVNYDGMKAWMEKWMDKLESTGYIWVAGAGFDGGTWGDHEPAYGGGRNNQLVATAFIYKDAVKLAEIARILGHDTDADEYDAFAALVRDAINAAWYDAEEHIYDWPYDGTGGFGPPPSPEEIEEINANQFQTDNVLPLAFGIVPDDDRGALCENLLYDVADFQDDHITTGATVLKSVLPVLSECGGAEIGYTAAENPTFPGWGYWFLTLDGSNALGDYTIITDTFWEAWYYDARSENHAFRGTIDDWLYEYVAGIKPASAAYREIDIKPYPVGELTYASAYTTTPLGKVSSSWTRSGNAFTLDVHVPVGATATVFVPVADGSSVTQQGGATYVETSGGYAVFEVGSGDYSFFTE